MSTKTVDEWGIIRYRNEKGELHREDGPAFINSERKEWWFNGKLHREGGPAYIHGDRKEWWINGKLHREEGPAFIDGDRKVWWLNGERYIEDEFEDYILKKKLQKVKDL